MDNNRNNDGSHGENKFRLAAGRPYPTPSSDQDHNMEPWLNINAPEFVPKFNGVKPSWANAAEFVPRSSAQPAQPTVSRPTRPLIAEPRLIVPPNFFTTREIPPPRFDVPVPRLDAPIPVQESVPVPTSGTSTHSILVSARVSQPRQENIVTPLLETEPKVPVPSSTLSKILTPAPEGSASGTSTSFTNSLPLTFPFMDMDEPDSDTWSTEANRSSSRSDVSTSRPSRPNTRPLWPLTTPAVPTQASSAEMDMCPYAVYGECRYGASCCYVHGDLCDQCGKYALHPRSRIQQKAHRKTCLDQHLRDMEFSFLMAETAEKTCYICYDVVMEKEPVGERRFGILPGCFHCYCLTCIRLWRQRSREYESRVGRSCPVCRVPSDYVVPSRVWVDNQPEKDRLIASYKSATAEKPCRYFDGGLGFCPFRERCFYLHEVDVERVNLQRSLSPTLDSEDEREIEEARAEAEDPDRLRSRAELIESMFGNANQTEEDRQQNIDEVVAGILAANLRRNAAN